MGYNVTDTTCFYGLAQVRGECARTLASFDEAAYLRAQLAYLLVGVATCAVTGAMYRRTLQYDAPRLQQRSFLLGAVGALTFVLRGIDPSGFRHVIPRPVVLFFSDACTSALYANYIYALGYWASIIQQTAAPVTRPLDLQWLERASIAAIALFYLVLDMYTFSSKGFHLEGMTYVQMLGSAVFLAVISAVFAAYGAQVHKRLEHFERQQKLHNERHGATFGEMETARSADLEAADDIPVAEERRTRTNWLRSKLPGARSDGPAAKIRRIIYVVEGFAIVVVAGQIYMAVKNSSGPDEELECANGLNCEDAKTGVSLMHWFQMACIWIIVWVYRKVDKKSAIPARGVSTS